MRFHEVFSQDKGGLSEGAIHVAACAGKPTGHTQTGPMKARKPGDARPVTRQVGQTLFYQQDNPIASSKHRQPVPRSYATIAQHQQPGTLKKARSAVLPENPVRGGCDGSGLSMPSEIRPGIGPDRVQNVITELGKETCREERAGHSAVRSNRETAGWRRA